MGWCASLTAVSYFWWGQLGVRGLESPARSEFWWGVGCEGGGKNLLTIKWVYTARQGITLHQSKGDMV